MWEYKREETIIGSYNPSQFMQLLNNYAKEGWELVDYWESSSGPFESTKKYNFRVVMKRWTDLQKNFDDRT
jgi:hypothetical protein